VSLASLLTPESLRARTGGYAFARGERYWKEGRVLACEVLADAIQGIVAGSADYHVRVFAHGRRLFTECTCPVGERGETCKHVVALALHHLAAESAIVVHDPAAHDRMFATRAELDAWAKDHRVTHELGVAADVLVPELSAVHTSSMQLTYVLRRFSLRDLGSLEDARRHLPNQLVQRLAAAAVARRLDQAAADVRDGLAEEDRPAARPADPTLEPLWSRLIELRRSVRASAAPRSRAARAIGSLSFDASTIELVWHEPTKLARDGGFTTVSIVTALGFAPQPALSCACQVATCTHGLALIDAALDLLADPGRATDAQRIAEQLLRPRWQRALAALAIDDPKPKHRPSFEISWQIEHELRTLTVTPILKRSLKKGGMTAGSRTTAARLLDDRRVVLSEHDERIAESLVSWSPGSRSSYPVRAFVALIGHPRVVTEDGEPIEVRRTSLGFTALAAGDQIRLEPSVDGARFSPRLLAPLLATFTAGEPLVVIEREHGRCLLIDVSDDARRLWAVLAKHGDSFPPESHPQLLDRLATFDRRLPIDVPVTLMGDRLGEAPTVVVRLRLTPEATLELEAFVRPAAGAPLYSPGAGPRDVMVVRDGVRGYVRRDLGSELAHVRSLIARLPIDGAEEGPPLCFRIDDVDAALDVVAAVQHPPPGLEAEWLDARPSIVRSGGPAALRVQVDHDRNWFGIDGELTIEQGRIELAVLLDAARRQRRFVRLDDRRWIELSELLRRQLAAIADQTFEARDHLELSPGAVSAIRALAEAGARVETTPDWRLMTERLVASAKLKPRPPAALEATLRPYQVEGHAWMMRLAAWGAGCCLADDMGLGKTVQTIAVLLDRARLGPALVLAPTSVSLNWVDELRRFAPSLRPVVYAEQAARAGCLASLGKRDVLIVSYGLLVRDARELAGRTFATLVVDEAQAVKNPGTRRAKAARAIDAGFRIALSGTPVENHLGELWSLFAIVFPGLLGSWDQFRERFAKPIEHGDPEARVALSRVLQPFLLRRTKQEVAPELPSRTEIAVPVALSTDEAELYEDARLAAVAHLAGTTPPDERQRFEVLAALTRLRLLASHPRLYDASSSVASSKMQRFRELVDELRSEGHRALVFSQFTSHLALVRDELDRAGFRTLYLDGSTPAATRAELIRRFQGGEGDLFLISLKAGGTGINLTAADYVIHLDPWWNPAVEDQATDRAHRIGQTRPVTVYRLIARGTVEEKILALHDDKRALVSAVLEGTNVAARLTTRDLMALLAAPARASELAEATL
jgi:superfamily II DNA or RNA helicase